MLINFCKQLGPLMFSESMSQVKVKDTLITKTSFVALFKTEDLFISPSPGIGSSHQDDPHAILIKILC